MKKKNLWMLATGALLAVGLISCTSNSKTVATPYPAAYTKIVQNPWQITSVVFKKSDQITDSLNYTSADSLSSSRISFGSNVYGNSVYQFADKNNAAWVGPMNDSTLFRYGSGIWNFDANWNAAVSVGNLSAVPDSLLFVAYDFNNNISVGPIFRSKINGLDSLHLQITYLDSSIMNTTTHTKYYIRKVVSFVPVSN